MGMIFRRRSSQNMQDSKTKKHDEMVEEIRKILKFDSLKFQDLEETIKAIGVDKCNLCTYCWDGKE